MLAHFYDSVDDEIVWAIIKKYLKPLNEEVLKKLEPE